MLVRYLSACYAVRLFVFDQIRCSLYSKMSLEMQYIKNERKTGDWHEAMRFCSKLGMSVVTIFNLEKQGCLYDVLESTVGESVMWTAAKQNSCGNKFEWCSQKLFFHLNPALAWKQQENISQSDKCVTFELDHDAKDGRISQADCKTKNRIICETRIRAENTGKEIVKECQALYKITNKQVKKISGPLSSYSFAMKCMVQCIAELLGMISGETLIPSTIFTVFRKLSNLTIGALYNQQENNKNSTAATSFLDRVGKDGAKRLKLELLDDAKLKADSIKFDTLRILTQAYHTCKGKIEKGKCNGAFSFMRCALEDTDALNEIWKNYDDGINLQDNVITAMYLDSKCQVFVDGGKCAEMSTRVAGFISSKQSKKDSRIYVQTLQQAFPLCAATGGHLPIFNTKEEFQLLFYAFEGTTAPILWGEVDKVDENLFWCQGGAKLPVDIVVNGTTDNPFFLVSLAGALPNLKAIQLDQSDVLTSAVYCVYTKEIEQLCKAGKRTRDLSALEQILNKFG